MPKQSFRLPNVYFNFISTNCALNLPLIIIKTKDFQSMQLNKFSIINYTETNGCPIHHSFIVTMNT